MLERVVGYLRSHGVPFRLSSRPSPEPAPGVVVRLGGAFGALTVIDEAVSAASSIAFAVFSPTDIVEMPYDDFSRLERPRIASFAIGGELPESEIA